MPDDIRDMLFPKLDLIYPQVIGVVDTAKEGFSNNFTPIHFVRYGRYAKKVSHAFFIGVSLLTHNYYLTTGTWHSYSGLSLYFAERRATGSQHISQHS